MFTGLQISKEALRHLDKLPAEYLERMVIAKKDLDNNVKTIDVLLRDNMTFLVTKHIKTDSKMQGKTPFLQKIVKALTPRRKKEPFDYLKNIEIEIHHAGEPYSIYDLKEGTYYGCWPDIPDTLRTLWNSLGIKNMKQEYTKYKQLDKLDQAVYLARLLDKVESKKDIYIQDL